MLPGAYVLTGGMGFLRVCVGLGLRIGALGIKRVDSGGR